MACFNLNIYITILGLGLHHWKNSPHERHAGMKRQQITRPTSSDRRRMHSEKNLAQQQPTADGASAFQ